MREKFRQTEIERAMRGFLFLLKCLFFVKEGSGSRTTTVFLFENFLITFKYFLFNEVISHVELKGE